MTYTILPYQLLHDALANGVITTSAPLGQTQIQPASLDLRLGKIAHRLPASFLPGGRKISDCLAKLATHQMDLSTPCVLERNCVHIIELLESCALPKNISARANPKSSSGRLDIFVRVITDEGHHFDDVPLGYHGPLYAEVVPRSFPVIATQGTSLCQLRLRQHEAGAGETASKLVSVSIDLDPSGKKDGIIGYRARRNAGLIDLAKINAYPVRDFWEPITLPLGHPGLVLDPDDFYILSSKESVAVGATEACEMIAYDPAVGELRVHYAGFLDPGFGLAETGGAGSRVVLEVRSHDVPFLVEHGQRVGTLRYEPLSAVPTKLYGADLGSNYQGQGLKLAKQFLPMG